MSTPATSPPPPPPPTRRAPRNREPLYAGVGVAVAVVVLLVVFVVTPVFRGSGSGTAGAVLTYSGARPVADRAVGGFEGGGWSLLFAAGLVSPTEITEPVNTSALSHLSCTFTPVGLSGSVMLPGYSGNRSAGLAPAWGFGYVNTAGTIALVLVTNGSGSVMGTLTGTDCAAAGLLPRIPDNAIDSSQAAAAVEADARAFLSAYPNASALFGLGPGEFFGGTGLNPEWVVAYSSCSSVSASKTGAEFNATVNVYTGAVLTTHTNSSVPCSSSAFPAASPVGLPFPAPAARELFRD